MTYSYTDLRAGAGLDLGRSRWITIDQKRIDDFAAVSEDHQWIHVDPDRASTSVFGSTIAHGYLTITVIGTLLGELLQVDNDLVMVNYGLDRLRFINPVRSGSSIRANAVIREVNETTTGLRLLIGLTGEVNGRNNVCHAVAIVLVRRESGTPQ